MTPRPSAPLRVLLTLLLAVGVAATGAPTSGPAAAPGQEVEGPAADAAAEPEPWAPVVVFLVRHGEKADDDPDDPGLSEAGRARARELARVLGGAGVTHLFASEYRRTRETLEPLARERSVEVVTVPARAPSELLARLGELPSGAVAVVAGHSNTVPALTSRLARAAHTPAGRSLSRALDEDEYDVLLQVVLPPASAAPDPDSDGGPLPRVLELRYGAGR